MQRPASMLRKSPEWLDIGCGQRVPSSSTCVARAFDLETAQFGKGALNIAQRVGSFVNSGSHTIVVLCDCRCCCAASIWVDIIIREPLLQDCITSVQRAGSLCSPVSGQRQQQAHGTRHHELVQPAAGDCRSVPVRCQQHVHPPGVQNFYRQRELG